jgi:hypothetical protein
MGGRRSREAEQQAEGLRTGHPRPGPRLPVLARIIMNSRAFQRLMERLDTREGARPGEHRQTRTPAPSRPSDRILPEKGPFIPRMHPLGGMLFRTRFVQRVLGYPLSTEKAPSSAQGDASSSMQSQRDEPEEGRSPGCGRNLSESNHPTASGQQLTEPEIREFRRKALISSLSHSASRWGAR